MSNTKQRIFSAIVLLALLLAAALIGPQGVLFLLGVGGVVLVDEIIVSMLKIKRTHFSYFASVMTYLIGYIFFNFVDGYTNYISLILNAGVCLNGALILYLFMEKIEANFFITVLKKNAFIIGLYVLIPILSLCFLIHKKQWINLMLLILILNSSVDIGAWFFGKKFGKKKLWPKISPNKTIIGLFGGVVSSVILSSLFIHFYFGALHPNIFLALAGLGIFAQIGDLIESKMKRQLEVKDSSNLIPGHGGIYDRVDSLIFIAPFFALMVRSFL